MGPELFLNQLHLRPKFHGYKEFVWTLDEPVVTVQEKELDLWLSALLRRETENRADFQAMTLMFVC